MSAPDPSTLLDPDLLSALAAKGYATLTEVQQKVLDPALAARDLRISSQTGSGKTLAIGFAVRGVVTESVQSADRIARPSALVITPTRELAKQVEVELGWLYRPRKAQVTSVTGGSSVRDEFRALARGPSILVGTPGRLLDHLKRGAIDLTTTGAVVLDEADRMLDLGFRDDLEAILALAGDGHRTHLVSATFPREVEALAQRVQKDPIRVQGTPLGSANADIDHMIHLVKPHERVDALINLLLASPGEQVLAFARTRADVARVCEELDEAGFAVDSLSGEMEQTARLRALGAFKAGKLQVLVATDVAARGIDHQDIARVVQLEPPNDADTYTHRSGRTGRAGRKGKSSIMVQPAGMARVSGLLKRAGVKARFEPIPTAEAIRAAQDERLLAELSGEAREGDAAREPELRVDPHAAELAARLMASGRAERALAHLIERTREAGTCAPREVTPLTPGPSRQPSGPAMGARPGRTRETLRGGRPHDLPRNGRPHEPPRGMRPNDFSRSARPNELSRGARPNDFSRDRSAHAPREQARPELDDQGGWVRFHVSWGEAQGADARRLLPMLCRRGNIRGSDIGAIQLAPSFSLVDVSMHVAADFERAARRPDPRDPAVVVRREGGTFGPVARPARGRTRPS
jgi:ATP-dependent RNA helicase DeaD